jgi:alpha-methylacyl-CoA racemase
MGPLKGFKVVEIGGLGPAPAAAMILADLGADVILVERKGKNPNAATVNTKKMGQAAFFNRGKRSIALDLKQPQATKLVLSLMAETDMLIEGFRPGVMERLGLGPDACFEQNKKLVYGRMTGWGQTGPLAKAAGHDLNYLSITGALHYSGMPGDTPFPTPTLVGDIGGGALSLALGMVSALLHAQRTGEGQVIDAAICDGTIYNLILLASLREQGAIGERRGEDFFTAGSHWCNTYVCADEQYITVQALEPNFYKQLITLCGFENDPDFTDQYSHDCWAAAREKMANLFASKPQAHWCELLEGTDACFAPVLSLTQAAAHSHNQARKNFLEVNGMLQPAPAPKFSATPQEVGVTPSPGQHTEDILRELNVGPSELATLVKENVI